MPNWKEFRFKIEGEIDGAEITPHTIPMARLAEYVFDLAALMGHKESVHLVAVEDGSTQPVILVDAQEEARVTERVRHAQRGMGPPEANRAYKRIDNKLRKDNAKADLINVARKADVIIFPGKNSDAPQPYGPIKERATAVGELKRVGGLDKTVPITLRRADNAVIYCEADEFIAKQLAPLLYSYIRVHGLATYTRGAESIWKINHFRIQSFDPQPLSDESFSATIEKLRGIPGSEWSTIDDPLDELRKLRHGEDKTPQ